MGILDSFKPKPSIEELRKRNEYKDEELSLAKKDAMMRELKQKGGKEKWKEMSDDGTKKGINWSRIIAWLKTH